MFKCSDFRARQFDYGCINYTLKSITKLKLSAASCGESSILKEQYLSQYARYQIQGLGGDT
jgi:hypothetical protein